MTSTLLAAGFILSSPAAGQAIGANVTPAGESVVAGSVTFNRPAPGRLNVDQSTSRAVINWNKFDIGRKATTEFIQPNSSALAVNRVTGVGSDPTQILGTLKSNGRIMVLDHNGVIFGKDSKVDVGGIIASTGNIENLAVTNGDTKFTFKGLGNSAIDVRGKITVDEAGLAAFVAPVMKNSGTITAKLGRVELAAGETVTVDFYGDDLVQVAAGQDIFNIKNTGKISAEGGAVTMSALTASQVIGSIINTTGLVDASSAKLDGGRIILSAGLENDITVDGKLFANGKTKGGVVEMDGLGINISPEARINVDSSSRKGGDINIFANTAAMINGKLRSSGAEGGGNITVQAADINVGQTGRLSAQAVKSGIGGLIALSATNANQSGGRINVNGPDGGGLVRLSGGSIDVTETIDARATKSGKGGDIRLTLEADGSAQMRVEDRVNASGTDGGGTIVLSANPPGFPDNPLLKITKSGTLEVEALKSGKGGNILVNAIDADIQGDIDASGAEGGGLVNLAGFESTVSGDIDAEATKSGSGGTINIDNDGDITIIGFLNAAGVNGGGKVRITGDDAFLQPESRINVEARKSRTGGGISIDTVGEVNARGVLNADGRNGGGNIDLVSGFVTLGGEATANATKAGNGGRIHSQGSSSNVFSGVIEAKGGPVSGDGGTVTIDDPNTITQDSIVDVSAPHGSDGTFNH